MTARCINVTTTPLQYDQDGHQVEPLGSVRVDTRDPVARALLDAGHLHEQPKRASKPASPPADTGGDTTTAAQED